MTVFNFIFKFMLKTLTGFHFQDERVSQVVKCYRQIVMLENIASCFIYTEHCRPESQVIL